MFDSYVLTKQALESVHAHSFENREEISRSGLCYCMFCKRVSFSVLIHEWADEGKTALCPNCGVDSVIGDASGVEMTPALMTSLHDFYFDRKFMVDLLQEDFEKVGWDFYTPMKED